MVVLDGINELVRELLRGNVDNLRAFPVVGNMVPDGMQKVCFSRVIFLLNLVEKQVVNFGSRKLFLFL